MSIINTFTSISAKAYGFGSQSIYFSNASSANSLFSGFGIPIALSGDGKKLFVGHDNTGANYATYTVSNVGNLTLNSNVTGNFRYSGLGADGAYSYDGSTLIIGAPYAYGPTGATDYGAVWVNNSATILQASDKSAGARFGYSVDCNYLGDKIVVGAYLANKAYVFDYDSGNNNWIESQIITGSNYFGYEVAFNPSNDDIFIGAFTANAGQGQVKYYTYANNTYTLQQTIDNPVANTIQFGQSIKAKNDYLIIGGTGSEVQIYTKSGNNYNLQTTLYGNNTFGDNSSLDLSDDGSIIAIGEYFYKKVEIYYGQNNSYNLLQTVTNSSNNFGVSLALSDDGKILAISSLASVGNPSIFIYRT